MDKVKRKSIPQPLLSWCFSSRLRRSSHTTKTTAYAHTTIILPLGILRKGHLRLQTPFTTQLPWLSLERTMLQAFASHRGIATYVPIIYIRFLPFLSPFLPALRPPNPPLLSSFFSSFHCRGPCPDPSTRTRKRSTARRRRHFFVVLKCRGLGL